MAEESRRGKALDRLFLFLLVRLLDIGTLILILFLFFHYVLPELPPDWANSLYLKISQAAKYITSMEGEALRGSIDLFLARILVFIFSFSIIFTLVCTIYAGWNSLKRRFNWQPARLFYSFLLAMLEYCIVLGIVIYTVFLSSLQPWFERLAENLVKAI